jgi:hypothetical protein
MMNLNTTRWAKAVIVAGLLSSACSSTNSNAVGAGAGAGGDGTAAGGSGDGGASAGGGAGGKGGASATGGATGQSGSGGAAATARGVIDLVQAHISSAFNYTAGGGFVRFAPAAQAANGIVCTASTVGACLVSACTITDLGDAGAAPPAGTVLDAGTLTITGAGASKATLMFGTVSPSSMQKGYPSVSADTQFFSGGDSISVVAAGGADLPAFKAQMVIAPNEVTLTAPDCSAGCPDLDRSQDLAVTWTGGGAGHVTASFETIGDTATGAVFCTFPAASGTGTVPKAALGALGDTRDGSTTGVEMFAGSSEVNFTVSDVPTTFSVQLAGVEGLLSVSK